METYEKLIRQLSNLIDEIVNSKLEKERKNQIDWKGIYEYVLNEVDIEVLNARSLIEGFSRDNLTASSIEAEGYLRAMLYVQELLTENAKKTED